MIGLALAGALALAGCKKDEAPAKKAPPTAAAKTGAATKPAAPAGQPTAGSDADVGKRLFLTACANCHGPDGTGEMMRQMMPNIGNLTLASTHEKYDDEAFKKLITEGRNKMPAFGGAFKPEQIDKIIAYARTLKK